MSNPTPQSITADRQKRLLLIEWDSGEKAAIPFARLRAACPCAQCKGGHENMTKTPDPNVFLIPLQDSRENEIEDIQGVGNYGVTVSWGDGHKFGIYTWEFLFALGKGESRANPAS